MQMLRVAVLVPLLCCAHACVLALGTLGPTHSHSHKDRGSPVMLTLIHTDSAPKAIGPYSQAVVHGALVYCAGQIALDPKSGELVGASAGQQAAQVLKNLGAVLEAAGSSLGMVVKTTVYLADMSDFAAVNEVYAEAFGSHKPARATVGVAGLPKGARVEIDCIASR